MHNDIDITIQPASLDPAVWRLDVPLAVLERADGPHLLSVWIAVRWLQAAVPSRRGFSTREIAKRAHVDRKYVAQWVSRLVDLDLLEIVGEEPIPNLHPRPIYAIPLAALEAASLEMAPRVAAAYRSGRTHASPPPLAAPTGPVTVRVVLPSLGGAENEMPHVVAPDPIEDQPGGMKGHIAGDIDRQPGGMEGLERGGMEDQPSGDMGDRIKEGRNEGGKDGAHTRKVIETGDPEQPAPPPVASPPLPAEPLTLWRKVRHVSRPMDDLHLQALIAHHDAPTEGYGAYWVGRAILAADATDEIFATNPRALNLVRAILGRWRREHSYGSDTPGFVRQQQGPPRPTPRGAHTPVTSSSPPTERTRWRTATATSTLQANALAPVQVADADAKSVEVAVPKRSTMNSRWRIATAGGAA